MTEKIQLKARVNVEIRDAVKRHSDARNLSQSDSIEQLLAAALSALYWWSQGESHALMVAVAASWARVATARPVRVRTDLEGAGAGIGGRS